MRNKPLKDKSYWDPKEYPKELREKAKKLASLGSTEDKIPVRIDKKTTIYVTLEKFEKHYK